MLLKAILGPGPGPLDLALIRYDVVTETGRPRRATAYAMRTPSGLGAQVDAQLFMLRRS
jgi:hypothetical protein